MDLKSVVSAISKIPMGATDCSLPFVWATKKKVKVDVFIVYTDNETNYGSRHPSEVCSSCNLILQIFIRIVTFRMNLLTVILYKKP